jgi:plasmid stabilization system protein ParE
VTIRVRVAPEAAEELAAAGVWNETRCTGLGADLLAAVDEALEAIARQPQAYPTWRGGLPFRQHVLRRFPYVDFFAVEADEGRILAIAHAKRRPGYWRDRR